MATKSRYWYKPYTGRYISNSTDYVDEKSYTGSEQEYLITFTSPGPPYVKENSFVHRKDERDVLVVKNGDGYRYQWENIPIDIYDSLLCPVNPEWQELTNAALAKANPNVPIVDLPLFLFELKELPALLREAGLGLFDKAPTRSNNLGNAYLAYQFGFGPLLRDLRTLLDLTNQIDQRLSSLKEANRSKTFRESLPGRSIHLDSTNRSHTYSNSRIYFRRNRTVEEKNWFTTRYTVDTDALPGGAGDKLNRLRWALGLNASASTVWNAVPWSWLIDYLSTIGSFLEANRGSIPWTASNMCIMCQRTYKVTNTVYAYSGFNSKPSYSGGNNIRKMKDRKVVTRPKARVRMKSFLTDGMRANLTALAISYAGGGRPKARYIKNG